MTILDGEMFVESTGDKYILKNEYYAQIASDFLNEEDIELYSFDITVKDNKISNINIKFMTKATTEINLSYDYDIDEITAPLTFIKNIKILNNTMTFDIQPESNADLTDLTLSEVCIYDGLQRDYDENSDFTGDFYLDSTDSALSSQSKAYSVNLDNFVKDKVYTIQASIRNDTTLITNDYRYIFYYV